MTANPAAIKPTSVRKVIPLLLLLAAGYFLAAYWSVAQDYLAIRYSAQKLANRIRRDGIRHDHITEMRYEVQKETGIELYGADINVTRPRGDVLVEINARLKAEFPLTSKTLTHEVNITAKAQAR